MPADQPFTAVIDTNLVVSAFISRRGAPHALLQALYQGAFRLLLSDALRQEYADVLARPDLKRRYVVPAENVAAFFRFLDREAERVSPAPPSPITVRDLEDAHALAAALGGRADYLVSGDADLLVLAGDPRLGTLRIVTIRAFRDLLAMA
ncbi:MAG TPA: putative toxin-antitoxin system toxin component, PIN family [Thermomicrobiales bacterium]|nr:putative toxin-antitoxin system toxin component, PIN family [Thermomicrobiales bacterium]